jgi:hypothetical protein
VPASQRDTVARDTCRASATTRAVSPSRLRASASERLGTSPTWQVRASGKPRSWRVGRRSTGPDRDRPSVPDDLALRPSPGADARGVSVSPDIPTTSARCPEQVSDAGTALAEMHIVGHTAIPGGLVSTGRGGSCWHPRRTAWAGGRTPRPAARCSAGSPPSLAHMVASPSSRSPGWSRNWLVDHRPYVAGLVQRVPVLHRSQTLAQPGEDLVVHVAVQVQPRAGDAAPALPADPRGQHQALDQLVGHRTGNPLASLSLGHVQVRDRALEGLGGHRDGLGQGGVGVDGQADVRR